MTSHPEFLIPAAQKTCGLILLPLEDGYFAVLSGAPLQPNPADFVAMLQQRGDLPVGAVTELEELPGRQLVTITDGEVTTRHITIFRIQA